MDTRWKVLGLAAACGVGLATVVMLRTRPAPVDVAAPAVEVFGFAEFPEPLDPFVGGTLQVRLVDLTSPDSAGLLIASSIMNVTPRSTLQSWSLRIPANRARFADDAYFVISVNDHKGVRFIGSGFPRELTHKLRGASPNPRWLGIRLTAVPAP